MDSPVEEEAVEGEEVEQTEEEKEFATYLEQIRSEEGLKIYADVYTKLYDSYFALKEKVDLQRDDIKSLENKIEAMKEETTGYTEQIEESTKIMEEQRAEIGMNAIRQFIKQHEHLCRLEEYYVVARAKPAMDRAKALCDAMHARELARVEAVDTLRRQAAKLEKELEMRKKAGADEDAGATSAAKEKEKFEKEKTKLNLEIEGLRTRLQNAISFQEQLDKKNTQADLTIAELKESLEDCENNAVRTNRLVEHLKGETESLKKEVAGRGEHIGQLEEKLAKAEKTIERRDRQLKETNLKLDNAINEMEAAMAKATSLKQTLDSTNVAFDEAKQNLANTSKELKNMTDEWGRLRAEMSKMSKQALQQLKKYQLLEQTKASVENERDRLRQTAAVMEREIVLGKKQAEGDKREIENLNREKEIMGKNMQKIQTEAMENLQMLHLQEQRRKKLEHEIEQNAAQINRQRLAIKAMEKEKDRMLEEAIALNEKIDDISEEVRQRTVDLTEAQKDVREETLKTRRLTAALDSTRAERNMLHKNYTEALDEIQDRKQKLKMLAYQIEQLKEDISGKETGLKTCEASLAKCTKKTEILRAEIQSGLAKLCDARAEIQALKQEEARLCRIIQEGDSARQKLRKELETLTSERDVVGAQLVRRNDEISLLYEKIRILEVTLHRGERSYAQRVEDIRLLRLEIIRLRKEKNLLAKGIENMTDLRLEVFNLERELGRERLRVRALKEALETPLNVHRWRKLAATEPDTVNMAHKLRLLQKKVLTQSETLVQKDRELKETSNLYHTVKETLALQPSPDIQQQLVNTQRALSKRTTKLKCLIAELSMREKQVCELRLELTQVNTELHSYKAKYFDMKRALDVEEQRRLRSPHSQPATAKV